MEIKIETKETIGLNQSRIEETINDMLDKVMEEDDNSNSLDFNDDELDDESFKISRNSTRHQTSAKSISNKNNCNKFFNNINRENKRNLTVNFNQISSPSFNNTFYNNNLFFMKNQPFYFSNNGNNNYFPNLYKNIGFNNNSLNQSYHSFNPSNTNNFLNNSIIKNEFIRNSLPYSKTVVYHNQGNILNVQNNNIQQNNFYKFGNNNSQTIFNTNNNPYYPINLNFEFKRVENRKKTYDTPLNLQNNIINYFNPNDNNINNNSVCCNKQLDEHLLNNNFSHNNNIYNNNIYKNIYNNIYNNINNSHNNNESINNDINNNNISNNNLSNINNNVNINESFIYELKHKMERLGKIDHNIYNLLKGKFLLIFKNHKGSKIFQKYLNATHSDEIFHLIFIEISPSLEELFLDPYANYFCKKFFTYLNQKDRIDFLKRIEKSLIKISSDCIGTYPIQTIIENLITKNEKMIIITSIKDRFKELIYDTNGCHVIEKILLYFEDVYTNFIYSYIFEHFMNLANNNNGICIIKKIMTINNKKKLHEKIKNIIKENALYLIQQQYGNFVIQIVIESWSDYKDIIILFKGYFFKLSLEKYASNVIERCIEKDEEILNNYIDEIIDSNCLYCIMKSNYGNYVVQKVIKLAKGQCKNKFVYNAAKDINKLNEYKIAQKWKSILLPHIKELNPAQIQELKLRNISI